MPPPPPPLSLSLLLILNVIMVNLPVNADPSSSHIIFLMACFVCCNRRVCYLNGTISHVAMDIEMDSAAAPYRGHFIVVKSSKRFILIRGEMDFKIGQDWNRRIQGIVRKPENEILWVFSVV